MIDWSRYPNFSEAEMRCKCCGVAAMDPAFLEWLQALRNRLNFPLPISSAYRCPKHNAAVSSSGSSGAHTTGRAVDIAVSGPRALHVVHAALDMGCKRVGIQQKGGGRFVHLDLSPEHPSPALWSY